jgi:hypothetical protein
VESSADHCEFAVADPHERPFLSERLTGIGPIAPAAVVGYNPDDHRVYWMEISSTGEYHAHRGSWKADTIEFEPLVYFTRGPDDQMTR